MTDRYAVIGNPVAHSKSPLIHQAFAQQTKQDIEYAALLAPLEQFSNTVDSFIAQGGKGLNVTVPFKQEAYRYAQRLSERAEVAQAVNTLRFDTHEIYGDNTDGVGLIRDIQINLEYPIAGKRILLMGAGGAARGVILPLLEQNPASFSIVNRTIEKAHELVRQFSTRGNIIALAYSDLNGLQFDLIINATSSSLSDTLPPLPKTIFANNSLAYDMMYGSALTPFLRFAKAYNASYVADGIGMLVEQAAESFFCWRGMRPNTQPVIAAIKQSFSGR